MEHATLIPHSRSAGDTGERLTGGTEGKPDYWDRIALSSGAIFVVVMLAFAPLAPMPPGPDASVAQITDWYQSHASAALLQATLRGLGGLLQLIFMAGLVSLVARTHGRIGALALLAFGGALGGTMMVLLSNVVIVTTAMVVEPGTEAAVVRTLDALSRMLTTFDDPLWALGYAATSLALLQIRAVPAWLGALGLVAASLLLVHAATGPGAAASNPLPLVLGLLGFALSLFWVLATSSTLVWRSRARRMGSRVSAAGVY